MVSCLLALVFPVHPLNDPSLVHEKEPAGGQLGPGVLSVKGQVSRVTEEINRKNLRVMAGIFRADQGVIHKVDDDPGIFSARKHGVRRTPGSKQIPKGLVDPGHHGALGGGVECGPGPGFEKQESTQATHGDRKEATTSQDKKRGIGLTCLRVCPGITRQAHDKAENEKDLYKSHSQILRPYQYAHQSQASWRQATSAQYNITRAPVAQLDRASDYGFEGWGFDSLRARLPQECK